MRLILEDPMWIYMWLVLSGFLVVLHFYRVSTRKKEALKFANVSVLERLKIGAGKRTELYKLFIRIIALFFICLAGSGLAMTSLVSVEKKNVVLAIDSSYSMLFDDYKPNRLEAAKKALLPFIDKIDPNTRVAVISFGPTVTVVQNFTSNKNELKAAIEGIKVSQNVGTAIGDALFISSRLLPANEPGAVILLTDGRNNIGILVDTAVDILKAKGIPVYTVGIGSTIKEFSEVDEDTLKLIAKKTGGISSMSTSGIELKEIYDRISEIVLKPKTIVHKVYLTNFLLIIALALILLEVLLGSTFLDILP